MNEPDNRPTLVSLFAGIGGFDLGLERAGFRTVGMCEIDPHARAVLDHHWPDVPKHDDVTTLTADTFGPADVITFGSPCQDLSVAGNRAGLDGERSGLFTEAVRYIRAMQEATNGSYPTAAVWENVPGAYSSQGGADFAAVLAHLVGGTPRTPPDGWPDAGVAFGPHGSAEWRTLDSQHFGVAQRRRRIFLVYRPRSERAGAVLLEPRSMPGDSQARQEARPWAATDAGSSPRAGGLAAGSGDVVTALTGGLGSGGPDAAHAQAGWLIPDTAPTLTASAGHHGRSSPRGDGHDPIVPVAFKVRSGVEVDSGGKQAGKGYLGSEDHAFTLATSQDQYLAEPIEVARTLTTASGHRYDAETETRLPVAFDSKASGSRDLGVGELSPTLRAMSGARPNGGGQVAIAFAENSRAELRLEDGDGQITGTLATGGGKPGQGRPVVAIPIQDGVSASKGQNGSGIGREGDPGYTLDTRGHQAVAFQERGRDGGRSVDTSPELAYALTAPTGGGRAQERNVAFAIQSSSIGRSDTAGPRGAGINEGTSFTLDTMEPHAVAFAMRGRDGENMPEPSTDGNISAIRSATGGSSRDMIATSYAVRRLTPRECERLQAFPDDWTLVGRYGPVLIEKRVADSHRYRMLGNAVTVTVVAWIGTRLLAAWAEEQQTPLTAAI